MVMSKHLLAAIASLTKAQNDLEKDVAKHSKILKSQGQEIAELQQTVGKLQMGLRNATIKAEVAAGTPGNVLAERYDLSPGRISQIKNSVN